MTQPRSLAHSGWVTFAGVLFVVAGAGNIIWGLGALGKKPYFPSEGVIYSTLTTWGWLALIWGIILLLGAVLLFMNNEAGRPTGIVLATISVIFWFFVLPVLPVFALTAIVVDVLIIYGLTAHGQVEEV